MSLAQSTRTAWCARCDGPQERDERGCIACAAIRQKHRARAKARQMELIGAGLCISGAKHGPAVVPYRRCARCIEVHRRSS